MRNLRQTCAAMVLTLTLAMSIFAGQISCPGAPAPGEVPSTGSQAPGEMPIGGVPADVPTCGLSALLTILNLAF